MKVSRLLPIAMLLSSSFLAVADSEVVSNPSRIEVDLSELNMTEQEFQDFIAGYSTVDIIREQHEDGVEAVCISARNDYPVSNIAPGTTKTVVSYSTNCTSGTHSLTVSGVSGGIAKAIISYGGTEYGGTSSSVTITSGKAGTYTHKIFNGSSSSTISSANARVNRAI